MATTPQLDPALLIGTWRLVKIQWHDKKVTHFTNPDKWQELTFKPDGTLEQRHKNNKDSPVGTYSEKWRIEKGKIIVTAFDKDCFEVEHLTDKGLVLKFITSDVRKGWRRVGDKEIFTLVVHNHLNYDTQ